MSSARIRVIAVAVSVAAALFVASCTTSGAHQRTGPAMMGAPVGYVYSQQSCSAPASLPGQVVTVTLADMGMSTMMGGTAPISAHMMLQATPSVVTAGQISFVARNMGWRTHELVILPLSAGATAGARLPGPDGRIDEAGSLGEASTDCGAGPGDGIPAGAESWVTLALAPGTYELLCNLANHYTDGMYQQLTVTAP